MADVAKKSWPELVGKTGEEATAAIKNDNPNLEVQVMPEDSMMTMDFREDRVRVMVDGSGKVTKKPMCG